MDFAKKEAEKALYNVTQRTDKPIIVGIGPVHVYSIQNQAKRSIIFIRSVLSSISQANQKVDYLMVLNNPNFPFFGY